MQTPSITYVARSFLDYRVPVFAELDAMAGGGLSVVYSRKWTPPRVQRRIEDVLGERAIGLTGEKRLGNDGRAGFANSAFCVPYQPGLYRAIAATHPDVLVADGFFRWTPAAIAYRLRHGTPLAMCYERTLHTERRAQYVRTLYRKLAAKGFDAVCCNGRLSVEYMQWLGYADERINTGHMAADTESLQAACDQVDAAQTASLRSSLNVQGLALLFVGRLIPLKGVRELLAAWKQFQDSHTGAATLVLVGDGPERENLERQAAQANLRNVRFVGAVDYDQIAPYYAMADALVIPTLEDNWSLVVPEAMACGLPILCSKYNGCWPELVHPNENGWVFDPQDTANTVECLQAFATAGDEGRLAAMGRRSREIVAGHTPKHAAQAIFDACETACRLRGRPALTQGEPVA